MKVIFLIMLGVNLLFGGVVYKDSATGLIWQDNNDAKSIKKDWNGARRYCGNLILMGKTDWRLPSVTELSGIVDIKRNRPAIKKGFYNVSNSNYWSNTSNVSDDLQAFDVYFLSGYVSDDSKTTKHNVRCVRGR